MKGFIRIILTGLLLGGLGLVAAAPASAEKYVAMGDSYSAGTGTNTYDWTDDGACQRSKLAYGPLIRADLGAFSSFKFAACSGAVVDQITTQTQGGNPGPQVSMLGNDTLDVTISIGGNDAGFGDVLLQCGYPLVSCESNINGAQSYITNTLPGKLDTAYNLIRQKAPNARVGVVSYPRLFPANGDDCSAATFFSAGEIARLNQTADMLADVTRARARAHGFAFVDARPAFMGHAWCENEWINGLSNPTNNSFHPNVAGYQGFAGIVRGAMLATPNPDFRRGNNGRIAFSSDRDGNPEIYVVNGNGGFPRNLTGNPAEDLDPTFSPDGSKLAFASKRSGNFEIYTMDSTGGPATRLTNHAAEDRDPSWSPNGKQIVFRSLRDGNDEIYKIDATGVESDLKRLTSNSASDFLPSFSPDGAEIVFQRYTAGSANGQGNEIFKMNADGQGQINLTDNAAGVNDGAPQWSPDGSQIAFHSNRVAAGNFEIYTMPTTGGTATRRTTSPGNDRNPSWAPSGSHLAFQADRDGSEQIYTMTANGSSQIRRTTGGATELAPSWQGDARPPVTRIDAGPPASSNNPVPSFEFSADEDGSSFECRLGTAPFQVCSSPFASASLADGDHEFAVRAKDPAGNIDGSPATHSFAIDTAAKVSEITAGPSGPTNLDQPVFEFTSLDATVTFECRLESAGDPAPAWQDCVSPLQVAHLDDGEYGFQVRGTDGVGNVEPDPPVRRFTVDTTPPESQITFGPPPASADPAPVFEFTSNEAGSSFECRLDGETPGEWEACETPKTVGELDDGEYGFLVRATDPARNQETEPVSTGFRIDTRAPTTTIDSGPGPAETSADVTFAFSVDEAGARSECRLDGLDDSDWLACSSPRTYLDLNPGRHNFQVRSVDPAGNVESEPVSSDFGIRTAPDYAITAKPALLSDNPTPAFEFESADPDAQFECRLDSNDVSAWEPCGSPFETSHKHFDPETGEPLDEQPHDVALEDGDHTFDVRGTDWFGEVTTLPRYAWTVVTGPPVASVIARPPALDTSGAGTFKVDGGYGASLVECWLDGTRLAACEPGVPVGSRFQTVDFSGLFDGPHEFQVRSKGSLFGYGPVAKVTWRIDRTAPQVSITKAPARYGSLPAATFEFAASEPGARLQCRLDGNAAGSDGFASCTSPHELTGLSDGEHRFEVRAVDEAGNVSPAATRTWTVDTTGPVVSLVESPGTGTDSNRAGFSFRADELESSFACRLDGAGWQACTSPVVFGSIEPGEHRFEVRATDALGNTGAAISHSWTVTRATAPPAGPTVSLKRKVKLKARGATPVAVARCRGAADCLLSFPRRASLRSGKKRLKVKLRGPSRIAAGKTGRVTVKLSARDRRSLPRRGGKLRLSLTMSSPGSPGTAVAGTVLLRR